MIYLKYIRMIIKSIMQYRLSMWLTIIGQFFSSFFAFFGIYLLFQRFGTIAGWSFAEVAVCFAVIQIAFATTECIARGFDLFSRFVVGGDFDRLLLRPRSTILQVFGSSFELSRLGRLIQSFFVMGIALSLLDIQMDFFRIVTLVLMVVSGVFIFTGIFMLGATICFFTVQGLEVVNIFTDGGREIASYPLSIYNKWLARFFTFIIPFGCINYLPLLYIVGRADGNEILYMLSPLFGVLFIVPCIIIWRFGVKHYLSTGS